MIDTTTPASSLPALAPRQGEPLLPRKVCEVHELVTGAGRPVWVEGAWIGTVTGLAGERLDVYRSRRGKRVVARDLDTGWDRDRDVFVLDAGEDERLFELLGFSREARRVYEALGVDPTWIVD